MPDLTENKDTRIALENIISVLSKSPFDPLPSSPLALSLMGAFHSAVQAATMTNQDPPEPANSIREPWKEVFWSEVATVARNLLAEQDLDDQNFTLQEWLDLRVLTISGTCLIPDPFYFTYRHPPHYHRNVFAWVTLSSRRNSPSHSSKANAYTHILQHVLCLSYCKPPSASRPPRRR